MKTIKILTVLAVAAGMMVTSCKKTSSPSASTLGVKVQATNKTFSVLKSASLTTPSFVWDTCFMNVSKVEFEAEKRESEIAKDSTSVNFEWKGSKKVDLFSINSLVGNISLQPGIYNEISIKLQSFKSDAGLAPVFYLSGTYTNSTGAAIRIVVNVNEDFEFKVKKEGTSLNAVNDYASLINLDLSLLMNGIAQADLDGATLSNGKIIISISSNMTLYDKIKGNLSSCEGTEFNQD